MVGYCFWLKVSASAGVGEFIWLLRYCLGLAVLLVQWLYRKCSIYIALVGLSSVDRAREGLEVLPCFEVFRGRCYAGAPIFYICSYCGGDFF